MMAIMMSRREMMMMMMAMTREVMMMMTGVQLVIKFLAGSKWRPVSHQASYLAVTDVSHILL